MKPPSRLSIRYGGGPPGPFPSTGNDYGEPHTQVSFPIQLSRCRLACVPAGLIIFVVHFVVHFVDKSSRQSSRLARANVHTQVTDILRVSQLYLTGLHDLHDVTDALWKDYNATLSM